MNLKNEVILGDNLDIFKDLDSESVDLIYIDPPFFLQKDLKDFNDKWKDMNEYLEFMKVRIKEIYRILKSTGSFYLHCDNHIDHYLRILCNDIFEDMFRSSIYWKRHNTHNDSKSFGNIIDVILYYSKSKTFTWNPEYVKNIHRPKQYNNKDNNGYFAVGDLTVKGLSGSGYIYEWNGITEEWRCPISTMKEWDSKNILYYSSTGKVYKKRYLKDWKGVLISNLWTDINSVPSNSKKRFNYSTQKPEKLLERIIKTSSNEGDIVMDCFCGSGTTCVIAKKLNRKYIGIDKNPKAIEITKRRLNKVIPKNTNSFI
jgi:DNA modification methylase